MLAKLKRFLTPGRRQAIYGCVTAACVALVAFNVFSTDQINGAINSVVTLAGGLATLMALFHVTKGEDQ